MPFLGALPPAESCVSLSAIKRAFRAGADDFEEDIRRFLGVEYCRLFSSGRAALFRLLVSLKQRAGAGRNQVLIPGFTCYSVPAAIVKAGLEIRCYDLDPRTFWPDMASVKALAGEKTLAIIGQHLFGIPTPMADLKIVAADTGAWLVEDAAQALGGTYEGKALGALGDFAILSFGRGKPLPLGKGGALVGNEDLIENIEPGHSRNGVSALAMTAINHVLSGKTTYGLLEALPLGLGRTIFDPGFPVKAMSETIRRLGKIALPEMKRIHEHRRKIADIYEKILGKDQTLPVPSRSSPVFPRFPVLTEIDSVPASLHRLGVRPGYPHAILDEPDIHPHSRQDPGSTPGSTEIAQKLITLPTHRGISKDSAKETAERVRQLRA